MTAKEMTKPNHTQTHIAASLNLHDWWGNQILGGHCLTARRSRLARALTNRALLVKGCRDIQEPTPVWIGDRTRTPTPLAETCRLRARKTCSSAARAASRS